MPGKKRCRLHGGLSTGPKTAEGKRAIAAAAARTHTTHGLTRSLESYEALVALGQAPEFELAPAVLDLTPEIRFARAKLGRATRLLAEIESGEGEGAELLRRRRVTLHALRDQVDRFLGRIVRLTSVQKRIAPGADAAGVLTLKVTVIEGRTLELPEDEAARGASSR